VCTLTWYREEDLYRAFFNRDERRTRKPGLPPERRVRGSVRFLAPLDGDHGGTWAAVNEHGLALFLLNGFPVPGTQTRDEDRPTRGRIPMLIIASRTAPEALSRLQRLPLHRYPPFLLALFEPGHPPRLVRWSGRSLRSDGRLPQNVPLVSSSFLTEDVRKSRIAVYRRLVSARAHEDPLPLHRANHRSHQPSRGALSPSMHRPVARTVSYTEVAVDPSHVRLAYLGDAPCRAQHTIGELTLDRA
jgi:hypothetical protein